MAIHEQFFRFALVGLGSNLLLYLAYLGVTTLGIGHKTAMSILYVTGVCLTFMFNRNWTFRDSDKISASFTRYILIYLFGYLVNYLGLYVFVDRMVFNHRLVQGVMIIVVATMLFGLQRSLVFHSNEKV